MIKEEYVKLLVMLYKPNPNAHQFYRLYKSERGLQLPPSLVNKYSLNANVFKACIALQSAVALKEPGSKLNDLHEYAAALNLHLIKAYGLRHSLPVSFRWFNQALKAFLNSETSYNYCSLISGNFGNRNATRKNGKRRRKMSLNPACKL